MIEDLRFIERKICPEYFDGPDLKTVKILQAFDGKEWFDVPLVKGTQDDE